MYLKRKKNSLQSVRIDIRSIRMYIGQLSFKNRSLNVDFFKIPNLFSLP